MTEERQGCDLVSLVLKTDTDTYSVATQRAVCVYALYAMLYSLKENSGARI